MKKVRQNWGWIEKKRCLQKKRVVLLRLRSKTWPYLKLWVALSQNLKIAVLIAADIPILTSKTSAAKYWRFLVCIVRSIYLSTDKELSIYHFIQSVEPLFSHSWTDTERFGVSIPIQPEYGKIRTRKTPNTDTFHAV